ncbi:tryptophan halogenase family protein [Hirschia litorea]|uniref:Tryptophan halogenase family protein n=1 Tax=Hirschia litorea TaxID=1199156 RepID=A0ABW2IP40_9PROT
MTNKQIKKVLIVGGGTAGWMTAAALSNTLKPDYCEIELVESEHIGTVGVGEASIPQIRTFNRSLGIDESEFVKRTKATFKLGIKFDDWGKLNESYFHPFGPYGLNMNGISFHAFFQKLYTKTINNNALEEYSLQAMASRENKFMRPVNAGNSPLSNIAYAYHFDAGLYAQFLRNFAETRSVKRTEGLISKVHQNGENGFITGVSLEGGKLIEADLFIDCSGFRGLLIEQALKTGYIDWSHWLPMNRAVAVPSQSDKNLPPYTHSKALSAGWKWSIPLQHRVGNGHVYCDAFISKDKATAQLIEELKTPAIGSPNHLQFTTGRRKAFWNKNCVAIGLSAGFIEPLESTSIHLIQSAIGKLLQMFPDKDFLPANIQRFNKVTDYEYERIRDFIILHYHATSRNDSKFWDYVRTMSIPDTLKEKIDLFAENGRIFRENEELFNDTSWFSVMIGQGLRPSGYDPIAGVQSNEETAQRLQSIRATIAKSAEVMPLHSEYLSKNGLIDNRL